MVTNPRMIPRVRAQAWQAEGQRKNNPSLTNPILLTATTIVLALRVRWVWQWFVSGCAVETLLIAWSEWGFGSRIFPSVHVWTILATLNLVYAVSSTSWLLYSLFAATCYVCVLLTCIIQYEFVADRVRRALRKTLRQLHFTKDKIAFFHLPALEIDTEVDGLMVIRGATVSLSNLTIAVHGVEVGIKLADDLELALYADTVTIPLFRRIEIGDVYANIKGGKNEMTFHGLEDEPDDGPDDEAVFVEQTPLLRAATAGSEGLKDRPKLRESLTGVSYIKDSSAKAGLDIVTTLSADDEQAEKQYQEILDEIRTSSAIYQARATVRKNARGEHGFELETDTDLRAAICAELHNFSSVPHPPERSIRVTTIQNLASPATRRFLHRLPLLLRLLLAPLGYFHPVSIASINSAGSGRWLSSLLSEKVFKNYAAENAGLRRLQRKVSHWLANANFCLQLTAMDGVGQVPVSTDFDIFAYLKFKDVTAYRTVSESGSMEQVIRLGGADATLSLPSYLLPHHEHIIPPRPTAEAKEEMETAVHEAKGKPKTIQAEKRLERTQNDETAMTISAHGSLPACFDQSLLNFIAALVKATKIIELEKEVEEVEQMPVDVDLRMPQSPSSAHATFGYDSDASSMRSPSPTKSTFSLKEGGLKSIARNVRQGLKEGSAGQSLRDFAKDLQQTTRDGMKKALVGGMVNDRWIAKMVGKVAAKLEEAQGDLGYSGVVPLSLEPYRPKGELPTKLLP